MLKETVMSALKEKKTLKKVILASLAVLVAGGTIVLTVCSCDSEKEKEKTEERAAAPTFDTREALAEYALDAMINKDAEAYLNTLSPEALQQGIGIFGSRNAVKAALREFWNMPKQEAAMNQLRTAFSDPEVKRQVIADMAADENIIQIDGKWYMNDGDWGEIAQMHTLNRMVEAAQRRDADAIWALLTNDSKTNMINRHGSEAKAKAAILAKFQIVPTSLTREAKEQLIDAYAAQFTRRGPGGRTILTEVDGKYFLNFNF